MTDLMELAAIVEKLEGSNANVNADILRALGLPREIATTPITS